MKVYTVVNLETKRTVLVPETGLMKFLLDYGELFDGSMSGEKFKIESYGPQIYKNYLVTAHNTENI